MVSARDPEGLSAAQSFGVTVPNRTPETVGMIAGLEVAVGSAVAVDIAAYFVDPDQDELEYSASVLDSTLATVAVSGGTVTVTGVAAGSTTVTVTARDPEGLSAEQSFAVTVPNRAPEAVGTIAPRVVERNKSVSFDVSPYFTDADGDDLTYSAASLSTATATVTVSGGTVTVTGRSAGTATITVTARDPGGLTATQRFEVTVTEVQNQAPQPAGTIPDRTVQLGEEISVDIEPYFTDPDGDDLTYSVSSSNSTIATAEVSGSTVEVKGLAKGDATITVTARDPGGLAATQSFDVTVEDLPNRAPVAIDQINDLLDATPGERYRALLTNVFADPDGDPLTYTASSTNRAVADPETVGDTIFVETLAVGSATISVTATDPGGLSATEDFEVTVVAARFDIQLAWTNAVTETHLSVFKGARSAWESVLRDTELPDVTVPNVVECLGLVVTDFGTVDDHLVLMHVGSIDGASGILAQARLCHRRSDGSPLLSAAIFDDADIGRVLAAGSLGSVAFHEFAHGLGFTTTEWDDHGLLVRGDDPHFTGALATAAFDAAGGTSYTDPKVPIEQPLSSHWRESVFGLEGMTPVIAIGVTNPFSAITLQAMADIGYVVDASQADAYQLPNTVPPKVAGDQAGQVFDLSNDVVRGPVMVLGADGRIERVIPAPPGTIVPSWPRREVQIERGGARNRQTGEPGREGSAREIMWQIVRKPAPSGRSR